MNKILLTGGLGYLGGRIIENLLSRGEFEIDVASRKTRIPYSEYFAATELQLVDSNELFAPGIPLDNSYEAIIHLAAMNETDSATDPVAAVDFNILSSLRLLEKAVRQGVPRFIYFSTAHVYGSPLKGRITEDTITRPVHPYSITHRCFEDFVLAARDRNEINGSVLRLSNAIGYPVWPEVNGWTLLVNDLCRQAVTKSSLTLKGAGIQCRDFISLTDVCNATSHILKMDKSSSDGLFNLGGNQTMSVWEMALLIQERVDYILKFSPPIIKPAAVNDSVPERRYAFEYSSGKLADTGFVWTQSITKEIDQLIHFCNRYFNS